MVRECRPPDRELSRSCPASRSTIATSIPASVNSAPSIIPVGPPPAITTACLAMGHPSSSPGFRSDRRLCAPTGALMQATGGCEIDCGGELDFTLRLGADEPALLD